MAREGTLADPPGVPSCAVCGSDDCKQFHNMPHPSNFPFLPGGYDPDASNDVQPREQLGARKRKGLRCRS